MLNAVWSHSGKSTSYKERRSIMARDPVCDMEVDERTAVATSEYKGKTYYFCALGCKKAFDADPEKYLAGSKGQ
jgi:YHS domain-containing protein